MTKIHSFTPIAMLTLALGILLTYNFSGAWTPPGGAPPSSNVPAPINVGATAQVKSGSIGARILSTTPSTGAVWTDRLCDADGTNCSARVPRAGEVGSLVFASLNPSTRNLFPNANSVNVTYGFEIEGRHLCAAGIKITSSSINIGPGDDNMMPMAYPMVQGGINTNNCNRLSGRYQSLGFSDALAGWSNVTAAVTLFQKISN
ncbi:MAG: hypothetical protein ACK42D_01005 [Candidatus Paceibacteria bacterium]